jgi:hypothetical protein
VNGVANITSASDASGVSSTLLYYDCDTVDTAGTVVTVAGSRQLSTAMATTTNLKCSRWTEFMNSLAVALVSNTVKSVDIITVSDVDFVFSSNAIAGLTQSCADPDSASQLLASVLSPVSSTGRTSVSCNDADGNSLVWQVAYCGASTGVGVCVGCDDSGASGSGALVTPCNGYCDGTSWVTSVATSAARGLTVMRVQLVAKALPPSISSLAVSSQSQSLHLNVSLVLGSDSLNGAANQVICTALGSVPNTYQQILSRGTAVWTTGSSASLSLTNLNAATSYSIYCMTMSAAGVYSSFSTALADSILAVTACCKGLTVSLNIDSVPLGSNVPAITVTLSSLPSSSVTVALGAMIDVTAIAAFFPQNVTFTSKSSSLTATLFAKNTLVVGLYSVSAVLSGVSMWEYGGSSAVSLSSSKASFSVRSVSAEPSTPAVVGARFSDNGVYVVVQFSSATDRGGSGATTSWFVCSSVLQFAASNSSRCQWSGDGRSLTILASSKSNLRPYDHVTVAGNMLRAECLAPAARSTCMTWATMATVSQDILPPFNPALPSVSISASSVMGSCDNLVLDLSGSTGASGRAWSVKFQVSSLDSNASVIETFLNSEYVMFPPTPVPATYFSASYSYSISAKLCNYLGACNTATHKVVVMSSAVPSVTVVGSSSQAIYRKSVYSVAASGFLSSCGSLVAGSYQYTYSWIVADAKGSLLTLGSTSRDPTKFVLPAYSLQSLSTYTVTVTYTAITSTATFAASSAASVFVIQGAVVAVIAGGNFQSLRADAAGLLDGSSSYDEDLLATGTGLRYGWACHQVRPSFSDSCSFAVDADTVSENVLAIIDSEDDSITSSASQFTLTVSDRAGARFAVATVTLLLIEPLSPVITVPAVATALFKVGDLLSLSANVLFESPDASYCVWTVSDDSLNLFNVSLTSPFIQTSGGSTAGSLMQANLVIPPNSLPARSTLVFSLSCYVGSSVSAASQNSITITTLSSPVPGGFSVSPSIGVEIQTSFVLLATNWDDQYVPLQYAFGFVDVFRGHLTVIKPRSYIAYATTQMSAGSSVNNFTLSCFVSVYNTYMVNATMYYDIQVTPARQTATEVSTALSTAYDAAGDDPVTLTQIVSLYGAILNRVNCSAAPNCTRLFRSSCLAVANTCGRCVDGYVGPDGDSNEACVLLSSLTQQSVVNGPCTTDSDCGQFGLCNNTARSCYLVNKECSDEGTCHGNGWCYFADAQSGSALTVCSSGSLSCFAACQCSYPYVGTYCTQTVEELAVSRASRELIVTSLSTLLTVQDADSESLNGWAASLLSSTQNSVELSGPAALTAISISDSIVSQSSSYSSNFVSFSFPLVSAALDNVAVVNTFDSAVDSNITELVATSITSVTTLLAASMLSGQAASSVVETNFRLSTVVGSDQSSVSLSSPLSPSESAFESRCASADIGAGSASASSVASSSFALVSLKKSLFNGVLSVNATNQTSAPVRLVLSLADLCARDIDGNDFTFTLNHIEEQTYLNESEIEDMLTSASSADDGSVVVRGVCLAGFGGNFTAECPSSNVTYTCDGAWDYNLTITCPQSVYYAMPSCSLTVDGEHFGSDMCTVLSADSWYTVCGCKVCDGSTRKLLDRYGHHRALGAGDQNLVDVVSSSVIGSAEAFVSVMSNPNALSSVADVLYVIRVIAVFAALWLGLPALWGASTALKKAQFKQQVKNTKRRASVGNYMNAPTRLNASKVLVDYALSILPGMYSSESIYRRCSRELREKVPLFIILSGNTEKFKPYHFPIILFKMLTTLTYGLFALSFFFTIQYPSDDGSCANYTAETDCDVVKSAFDKSISKCLWTNVTTVTNGMSSVSARCSMAEPVFNAYMNVVMCVLVVLATTPILFVLEKLFSEVLLAPTAGELDGPAGTELALPKNNTSALAAVNKAAGHVAGQVRRASVNVANHVTEAAAALTKHRKHQYKVMEENIVLPAEIIKSRFTAVQVCGEIPVFKAIANEIKLNMAKEIAKEGCVPAGKAGGMGEPSLAGARPSMVQRVSASIATAQQGKGAHSSLNTRRQLSAEHDWKQMMLDLRACRKNLHRPEDREAFDSAWGIESVSKEGVLIFSAATRDVLRKEYIIAHTRGTQTLTAMKSMPRSMCGAELMKLFFVDMVGTSSLNSKILTTSVNEAVLNKKRVVTWGIKCSVIAGLILVNLFFVYSSLLYAANRDMHWQYAWIINAVINIVIELICGPCLESYVLDCLIPGTISPAIYSAKADVNRQLTRLCDRPSTKLTDRKFPDVTCKYFFASRVVANRRPDLMESSLIHGYETSFPFISEHLRRKIHERHLWHERQAERRHGRNSAGGGRGGTLMTRSWVVNSIGVTAFFTMLLRYLGTLPVPMQKFTMQLTQPLFIGVFGFGFSFLVHRIGLSWTVFVVSLVVLGIAAVLAYVLYALSEPLLLKVRCPWYRCLMTKLNGIESVILLCSSQIAHRVQRRTSRALRISINSRWPAVRPVRKREIVRRVTLV